jgi:hypothetical protein
MALKVEVFWAAEWMLRKGWADAVDVDRCILRSYA